MTQQQQSAQKVKVALVVSGAISLGSFEAGVIAELLRAAQEVDSPIEIDIIGGASAGAITGTTVAYYLTRGVRGPEGNWDEFPGLSAWKNIDVDKLTHYNRRDSRLDEPDNGLLSRSVLLQTLADVLDPRIDSGPGRASQDDIALRRNDVLLLLTLTDLHGYEVSLADRRPGSGVAVDVQYRNHEETVYFRIPARTDKGQWDPQVLRDNAPDDDRDVLNLEELTGQQEHAAKNMTGDLRLWSKIFNYCLTSAANPIAWSPRKHYNFRNTPDIWWPGSKQLRDLQEARATLAHSTADSPLYFSDGGTVDNRPILKILEYGIGLRAWMDTHPGHSFVTPNDLAFQPQDLTYAGHLIDPDRMLLFIEPDPKLRDNSDDPASAQDFDTFLGGSFRALQVRARAEPNYKDLLWVGEANRSLVGTLQDLTEWGRLQLHLGTEGFRLSSAAEGQLQPEATGDEEVGLIQAIETFFATWVEGDAWASAALQHVAKQDGKWRPLAELEQTVVNLKSVYRQVPAKHKPAFQAQMARYLQRRGSGGHRWIYLDRIAPETRQPLGRTLMHFGGFIDPKWMEYDFLLGRATALDWFKTTFQGHAFAGWMDGASERRRHLEDLLNAPDMQGLIANAAKPLSHLLKDHKPAMWRLARQLLRVLGQSDTVRPDQTEIAPAAPGVLSPESAQQDP